VETIYAFEGDIIKEYPGNYSAYLEKTEQKSKQQAIQVHVQKESPARQTTAKKKGLSFNEKREFEALEQLIPQKEIELSELHAILEQTPAQDFKAFEDLSKKQAMIQSELDKAMDRWLELSEK
jgi:ATP-binding cassette subfamily F protein uup